MHAKEIDDGAGVSTGGAVDEFAGTHTWSFGIREWYWGVDLRVWALDYRLGFGFRVLSVDTFAGSRNRGVEGSRGVDVTVLGIGQKCRMQLVLMFEMK